MSEALNSSDIEDVLSSIRRLVSDDMRPVPRGPGSNPDAEKLLLTPALRVVQSAPRTPNDAPAIDEVLASVGAKVDAQGEDWESETGDLSMTAAEPMADEDWSLPEEAGFIEAEPEDQILTFVSHRIEVANPESAEPEPAELPAPEIIAEYAFAPEILPNAQEEPLPGWAQSSEQEEDEVAPTVAWDHGTIEPDQAWADEAEAEVLQELAAANPAVGTELDTNEFDIAPEGELPLTEEVLREIVRDVLREELQGRLGERITRNIRKLVRAEIARVMATEEFL